MPRSQHWRLIDSVCFCRCVSFRCLHLLPLPLHYRHYPCRNRPSLSCSALYDCTTAPSLCHTTTSTTTIRFDIVCTNLLLLLLLLVLNSICSTTFSVLVSLPVRVRSSFRRPPPLLCVLIGILIPPSTRFKIVIEVHRTPQRIVIARRFRLSHLCLYRCVYGIVFSSRNVMVWIYFVLLHSYPCSTGSFRLSLFVFC